MNIANNLGYTDTRMVEQRYKHVEPSHEREMIHKLAPDFGLPGDPTGKIAPLAPVRRSAKR